MMDNITTFDVDCYENWLVFYVGIPRWEVDAIDLQTNPFDAEWYRQGAKRYIDWRDDVFGGQT